MKRWHIIKDGNIVGSAPEREQALIMIHMMQQHETHYMLRAQFSLIYGEEELIDYEPETFRAALAKYGRKD